MSKDKAEEKAREYALKQLKYHIDRGDKELTYSTEACINIAAKDYLAGYNQVVTDLSTENAQLREALKEIIKESEDWIIPGAETSNNCECNHYVDIDDLKSLVDKAKQLLTNTKEDEKE